MIPPQYKQFTLFTNITISYSLKTHNDKLLFRQIFHEFHFIQITSLYMTPRAELSYSSDGIKALLQVSL